MPFLSLLDDRAKPKGSRDPLGFEMVWSYFGRKVIGNLTTITSSIDNFAVAVLGFYWANRIASGIPEAERDKQVREIFLRYEQLTGYIRHYGNAVDIMGITRIKQRLLDEKIKITLGLKPEQQILSDQASYGLWGLYSTAARDTGLVRGNIRQVTELGEAIAGAILQKLGETGNEIFQLLQSTKPLKRDQLEVLAPAFMRAIQHKTVQAPLLDALMTGNDTAGIQKELWGITRSIFETKGAKPETVRTFIEAVLQQEPSQQLSQCLHEIKSVERVLVAANNLFHYCRRKDGERLEELLHTLDGRYHYAYLPDHLPDAGFPRRDQLASILASFHQGDMKKVINELFMLNKEVMQQRSGAPWVELEQGRTLRVKVAHEKADLRKQEMIEQDWDYDYFLGSFLAIASRQAAQR